MLKKSISIFLALLLAMSVFAGCTKTEKKEEVTGTSTTETTKDEEDKVADGGKITVYANAGNMSLADKPSDPEYLKKMQEFIKKETGIEVNYIVPPREAAVEKLNALLASGDEIDTFKCDVSVYQPKGALMPLDDLIEKYGQNLKKMWPETWAGGWAGVRTPDGQTWGVPEQPALAGYTVYLREDMLEKVGASMPTTTDELKNVLMKFKEKDPVGNEQTIPFLVDLLGINMSLAAGWMDVGFDRDLGGFEDADGKYKPMPLAPGYKEFIAEMADWYEKGLIYKESFTINRDRQMELIKNNRVAGSAVWYTTHTTPLEQLRAATKDKSFDIGVADVKGPKGLSKTMRETARLGWVITKKSKNPEGVMKYMNYVQESVENYMTVYNGFEGELWEWTDHDPAKGKYAWRTLQDPNDIKYRGEYAAATSVAITSKLSPVNAEGEVGLATKYFSGYMSDIAKCKTPSSFGFSFALDKEKIISEVGSLEDIKTHVDSEVSKFIMGSRPMSEWDNFLKELEKIGVQKWIDAHTSEYVKAKK